MTGLTSVAPRRQDEEVLSAVKTASEGGDDVLWRRGATGGRSNLPLENLASGLHACRSSEQAGNLSE